MSLPPSYLHRAFGLTIRSCLPLPELMAAPAGAEPDIAIDYGEVPAELPGVVKRGVRYQTAPDALRLQVDGIATYLVQGGRSITIARDPAAEDDDVRLFLLASVLGALLHQRDDLVLHGSAIEWEGGAVGFLGHSGVGKSTLATAFRQRGHAVLTDDLCVLRPAGDGPLLAYPGFPQAKLWLDSLQRLDIPVKGLRRIRNKLEKRAVPLGDRFSTTPLPVRALYVLRLHNKDELKLVPLNGAGKFRTVRDQTYRFGFMGIEDRVDHFQHALRLAQQTPIAAAVRPVEGFKLDELVAMIEGDLRA